MPGLARMSHPAIPVRQRRAALLSVALLSVALLGPVACGRVWLYQTDGATAFGAVPAGQPDGAPRYDMIEIDPRKRRATSRRIYIRLVEGGEVLPLDRLTFAAVSAHFPAERYANLPPSVARRYLAMAAGQGIETYSLKGTSVSFRHGELARVSLCSACAGHSMQETAAVGTSPAALHRLPLTGAQVTEIFGPAIRTHIQNEIYYPVEILGDGGEP